MKNYQSLNEALSDLKEKGYEANFGLQSFCLYCGDLDMRLDPEDFHVDYVYSVEAKAGSRGLSVYAISTTAGAKGYQVDKND